MAKKATKTVPGYQFTDLTEKVEGKNTLQRRAKGDGKEWRKHGKIDTSIRYQALAALAEVADETGFITKEAALEALKGVNLGCSTPATRLSKFVRSGHLEVVA